MYPIEDSEMPPDGIGAIWNPVAVGIHVCHATARGQHNRSTHETRQPEERENAHRFVLLGSSTGQHRLKPRGKDTAAGNDGE